MCERCEITSLGVLSDSALINGDDLKEWFQKEAIVSQQVVSMIPDSLYLQIRGKPMVKEAWDLLKSDFE